MEYDSATGLHHTQNRYYAPQLQRWLSEDPLGVRGGTADFMTFVNNDPVNLIDPFGKDVDPLSDPLTTTTIQDGIDPSTESPVLSVSHSPSDIALDSAQNSIASGNTASPGVLGGASSDFTSINSSQGNGSGQNQQCNGTGGCSESLTVGSGGTNGTFAVASGTSTRVSQTGAATASTVPTGTITPSATPTVEIPPFRPYLEETPETPTVPAPEPPDGYILPKKNPRVVPHYKRPPGYVPPRPLPPPPPPGELS
jgi:RHS repeat-associated protein